MKKNCILLLFIVQLASSQTIEVFYDLIPKKIEKSAIDPAVSDIMKSFEERKDEFILQANTAFSHFYMKEDGLDEKLSYADRMSKKLNYMLIGYKPYYYDKKENNLYFKQDNFLIKKANSLNWEITSETKKIDAFVCYKAIYKEKIINRLGEEKEREIAAWFTPDIPYSFGPLEFNGLPGLILELEKLGSKLVAKTIKIDKEKTIEIEKPKGK